MNHTVPPLLSSVEQAIDHQPLVVAPNVSVAQVVQSMNQQRVDYAIVLDQQALVGIFTARDLTRMIAAEIDLTEQPVSLSMTRRVVTLAIADLQDVLSVLSILRQHHIRHLPLLDDEQRVLGVITPYSIRTALQPIDLLKLRRVAEVMATEVVTAPPTITMLQISQQMMVHRISCIVITETDETGKSIPKGILTERDLVRLQASNAEWLGVRAEDEMSCPLQTVKVDSSLWDTHQSMQQERIRRLVVVDNAGYLTGIITQSSLLKAIDPLELSDTIAAMHEVVVKSTAELQQTNHRLQAEIAGREQAEANLRELNQTLEERVRERAIALSQAEGRYRTLVEHSPDIIARFDRNNRFVYVNKAVEELLGLHPDAFLGKTHPEIKQIPHANALSCQHSIQQVFTTGAEVTKELNYPTETGHCWMQVRFAPEVDATGSVETVLAIARDITSLKQAEADTQRALAREQELSTLKTMFIDTVSHEFRTPLTIITMGAELLQHHRDRYDATQTQARFSRILEATREMTHLLDNFLIISGLMSGHYEPNLTPTNLVELCCETIQNHQATESFHPEITFTAVNNHASARQEMKPPICTLDAGLLRIALNELLSNAVKFSPNGKPITLTLTSTESELIFHLQDRGIGIPEADLPNLFQRFFRASNVSTIRGNGIGLAIVEYCIDYLQGTISFESQVEVGTTVTLRLKR